VEGDREKCLAAGMDDYLSKPFKRATLEETLERWIDADAGGRRMNESTPNSDAPAPVAEATAEPPAIDLSVIESLRSLESPKRPALVADVIRAYAQTSVDLIDDLRASVEDQDADGVNQAAHALKSSSRNLGAEPLGALCAELEAMGREGDLAGSKDLFERVIAEHRRALEALQSL
jgi:HPt (histidine-containing phosphotransfer) domain-containing protein